MASNPGILHQYVREPGQFYARRLTNNKTQAPRRVTFEYRLTTSTTTNPHSLLFVGGLGDGLYTVPYATELAKALAPSDWSVFVVLLSSSYNGWGISSLDQDVEEIAECVRFVQEYKDSQGVTGKTVVMGHSTGSQDVLHYLYSPNPLPHNPELETGVQHVIRPALDGAIMQAPVSDREAMISTMKAAKEPSEVRAAFDQLVEAASVQPYTVDKLDSILPLNLTKTVGLSDTVPVSARRFLSLASPDSPDKPSDDDLFSSDLRDQRFRETFGAVASRGLLRSKLLVLYSGSDEFAAPWIDKERLMQRWKDATNAGGSNKWDDNSGVVPGASHNVKDEGQADLIARVSHYLKEVEKV